jgi:2-hydroxyacyl-CoA lyase 1
MNSPRRQGEIPAHASGLSPAKRHFLQRRFSPREQSGHDLLAATLREIGVTHVYGVSGTPIHETLARCSQAGVRPIGVRHQHTGVLAALAQNYLGDGMRGVPIFSAGPAVTNGVSGALFARDNCWPLLALGGRRPLRAAGTGEFQELDGVPLFAPLTKHATVVRSTDQIAGALRAGAREAISGRPGPVYLDLADEALKGTAGYSPSNESAGEPVAGPPEELIARAAELLHHARRPAVVVGKGARWRDAYVELRALVEMLDAPFVASPMARGLLPDDHPLAFTSVSGAVQAEADVVLMVGARWNWQFRFGSQLARDAQVVMVDIHAPEFAGNVQPMVGLAGDARPILQRLQAHLRKRSRSLEATASQRAWLERLHELRRQRRHDLERKNAEECNLTSYYGLMQEIARFLPADAITILDGHLSLLVAQEVIPCRTPLGRLTVGANGCIGVGIPFAIGAKLTFPERTVVAICGDSAFGFCAMELETAVRHGIRFIVVVVDNQGIWGGHIHRANYPPEHERVTMYGGGVRYDRLAEGLGAHGEFVEDLAAVRPALERAATAGRAACVHVRVAPLAAIPTSPQY